MPAPTRWPMRWRACCGRLLLLLLLLLVRPGRNASRDSYDLRAAWGACPAFAPLDQGNCSSCCAAALAVSLGVRVCIRDGRATAFSARRVWDCGGGTCALGVELADFVQRLLTGPDADRVLAPASANDNRDDATVGDEPNASACAYASPGLGLDTAATHTVLWRPGALAPGDTALRREVVAAGPVVAVLRLYAADFARFARWRGDAVFAANATPGAAAGWGVVRHCLSVHGWGDGYWLVQNSFGPAWGVGGFGRLARGAGLLEAEWYAFVAPPQPPCDPAREACLRATAAAAAPNVTVTATNATATTTTTTTTTTTSVATALIIGVSVVVCWGVLLIALAGSRVPQAHRYHHPA